MTNNIIGLVPLWTFTLHEVSIGHYQMRGIRVTGHVVEAEGADLISLALKISDDALSINSQINSQKADVEENFFVCSKVARIMPKLLHDILLDEILLGNSIDEEWKEWGQAVLLHYRFRKARSQQAKPLVYRLVDDPHYWYEEVGFEGTKFIIAAKNNL